MKGKKLLENKREMRIEKPLEKSISVPSLDEILEPVRAQFAASGLTEDELEKVFEEERQAIWEEKQRKRA